MIYNFPCIYKDELLYSVLGRYHLENGDKNTRSTLMQLFGKSSIIPVVDIPCGIEELCRNIPMELGYNSDLIIANCTLFPFYAPFMSLKKRKECINSIKFKNGKGIKSKIGIIAGGICKKNNIYYCPKCVKEEIAKYGETYIHRLHQVQGVYICEKHLCKLKEYKENNFSKLKINYINAERIDNKPEFFQKDSLYKRLLKITKEVKFVIDNDLSKVLNQDIIYKRYYKFLFINGYLTASNRVKESKLIQEFISYYSNEFLKYVDSSIEPSDESNWLKTILRRKNQSAHPIRHILLIDFLAGDIDNFIKYKEKQSKYPCLNHFCKYYRKDNKTQYKITADYKTRELIVTVKCNECGFIYSRKFKNDVYKVGRVKNYGPIWMNKLNDNIKSQKIIRAIAREMKCDCKTVIRYAQKLGCYGLINSNIKIKYSNKNNKLKYSCGENYKKAIIKYMNENPSASINDVRYNNYKEYGWLYRNDTEWLKMNLPQPSKDNKIRKNRVDWGKRDNELLLRLKKEYNLIKESGEPIRITKTLLARRSEKLSYIEKKIDKLPLCKKYIDSVQESAEDYQIKRVDVVCNELYQKNEGIVQWKVKKLAGLKGNVSYKVQLEINNFIKMYYENA